MYDIVTPGRNQHHSSAVFRTGNQPSQEAWIDSFASYYMF